MHPLKRESVDWSGRWCGWYTELAVTIWVTSSGWLNYLSQDNTESTELTYIHQNTNTELRVLIHAWCMCVVCVHACVRERVRAFVRMRVRCRSFSFCACACACDSSVFQHMARILGIPYSDKYGSSVGYRTVFVYKKESWVRPTTSHSPPSERQFPLSFQLSLGVVVLLAH